MIKKRYFILFCCSILLLHVLLPFSSVLSFELNTKSAVLMEADTGQILFEQNMNYGLPPASLTKMMTLLLVFEEIDSGRVNFDDILRTSSYAASIGGSQVWLEQGEERTLEEMIIAIAVGSANDASAAVAEYLAGTEDAFVRLMNQKAEELNLKNTYFENPHGLPSENQKMSAYDAALLARKLTEYPEVLNYTGLSRAAFREGERGELNLFNTNKLVGSYEGMDGLRTGYTSEAGYCLVSTAKRDNRRLISVIMGADSETERYEETVRLLDYGYRAFYEERIVNRGEVIEQVPISGGTEQEIGLVAADDLFVLVQRGSQEKLERQIKLEEDELNAPVEVDEIIGELVVLDNGQILGSVPLAAGSTVSEVGLVLRILRWIYPF